jgi:hypothetical protein
MVGPPNDFGIIPRVCKEMFSRIEKDSETMFRVEASMMEIYNEVVRDLFNPTNPSNSKGGLKVRENPISGPYVEGLENCVVHNYDEIHDLMEEGNKMRTIAKTNMNDTSSRAHTIFQLIFTQQRAIVGEMGETTVSERVSRISLIDLAGSERVSKTGATGARLKEGSAINVSLTTLGNVINKLAEMSEAVNKKKVFVPYRDSTLTWLLKDSLGGNSKTIMIAAISPSDFNYEETLSTLRYANRAKNIQNRARINEDPNVAVIRELREEIERLRQLLLDKDANAQPRTDEEKLKLMDQLEASQRVIEGLQRTSEEKEKRTLEVQRNRQKALSDAGLSSSQLGGDANSVDAGKYPHFINLNEDPMLSGILVYFFKEEETHIGREKENNQIVLTGLQIQPRHCIVYNETNEDGECVGVTITPVETAMVYVNGKQIHDTLELLHCDRIILGNNHVFKFHNPLKPVAGAVTEDQVDWSFAQKELAEEQGRMVELAIHERERELEESMKNRLRELEDEFEVEKLKQQQKIDSQMQELEEQKQKHLRELAEKEKILQEREKSTTPVSPTSPVQQSPSSKTFKQKFMAAVKGLQDKFKKRKEEVEQQHRKDVMDRNRLDLLLIQMLPLIKEGNDIAKEMKKPVKYDLKIVIKNNQPLLNIQVFDRLRQRSALWSSDEFESRLIRMRERYEEYQTEGDDYKEIHMSLDPFFDLLASHIGFVKVSLKNLALNAPTEVIAAVVDNKDVPQGKIHINIDPTHPTSLDGAPAPPVKYSEELIQRPLYFIIKIRGIKDLRPKMSKNTYVRYKFYTEDFVSTNYVSGRNPVYNFNRKYSIKAVNEELLSYLEDAKLTFDVFGEVSDRSPSSPATSPRASMPRASTSSFISEDGDKDDAQNLMKENEELKKQLERTKSLSNGSVELSLKTSTKLDITVYEADKLPKKDIFSKSEYCCKSKLISKY